MNLKLKRTVKVVIYEPVFSLFLVSYFFRVALLFIRIQKTLFLEIQMRRRPRILRKEKTRVKKLF